MNDHKPGSGHRRHCKTRILETARETGGAIAARLFDVDASAAELAPEEESNQLGSVFPMISNSQVFSMFQYLNALDFIQCAVVSKAWQAFPSEHLFETLALSKPRIRGPIPQKTLHSLQTSVKVSVRNKVCRKKHARLQEYLCSV
jgi:hypothetical protein